MEFCSGTRLLTSLRKLHDISMKMTPPSQDQMVVLFESLVNAS